MPHTSPPRPEPDISLIMPCYNEEDIVGYTTNRLLTAFSRAGYTLELVAVDNGSADRTGEIIQEWASRNPMVVYHHVEVNEGYGNGVLSAIPYASAPWVGIIPSDSQVDAEDVVRLYEAVISTNGNVLGKVRRRFRMDGPQRHIVSLFYNLFVRLLWPRLESLDINGSPKLLPRPVIRSMDLQSKGWLLDPEIMIKAYYMGVHVLELNVFSRMRGSGTSHVGAITCWEFLRYLISFRFSKAWRENFKKTMPAPKRPNLSSTGTALVQDDAR